MNIIENIFFNLCAIIIVYSSIHVVLSKDTVKSVLYLVLVYIFTSFILLLLNLEFLGLLYILIYVGAIMVLFLFVIMMLNIKYLSLFTIKNRFDYRFYIFIFCFFFYYLIFMYEPNGIQQFSKNVNFLVNNIYFIDPIKQYQMYDSLALIGSQLYTKYFIVFIMSGLLLLIAMIGSITLTLIKNDYVKKQDNFNQIDCNYKNIIKLKDVILK